MDQPRTVHIMAEAVEPAGPWRLFIGDAGSATMYGPYTNAAPVVDVLAGTIQALRSIRMDIRVDGDTGRLIETFRASGVDLPDRVAAVMRGQ